MPLARVYQRLLEKTRTAPAPIRFAATIALTLGSFAARMVADPIMPPGYPFLLAFAGIVLSAGLFDVRAGLLSVGLSSALVAYFYFPPVYSLRVETLPNVVALVLFAAIGAATVLVLETLHASMVELRQLERRRALLVTEYRHRSRNDLLTLGALLLLRARFVRDEGAKAALREAAAQTRHLAMIHARLSHAAHDRDEVATVDAGDFVLGLCADLGAPTIEARAEGGPLSTERGVQLGLLLVELVGDARRDGAGRVQVYLERGGADWLLRVVDDRPRPPACEGDSLRARMVRGLATQLRGAFSAATAPDGACVATLRFPIEAPSLAPGRAGT